MNDAMHRLIRRTLVAASIAAFSLSATAALPQPGLWSIGGELNGKPGRGLQIDRQSGETVIVSYFGYRADGAATFFQAVGKITDGKTLDADLVEYMNGKALGGKAQDAQEARVVGRMRLEFSTSTSGTVSLPGEAPRSFARYAFEDTRGRLNNRFQAVMFESAYGITKVLRGVLEMQVSGDDFVAEMEFQDTEETCRYFGKLVASGDVFNVPHGSRWCSSDVISGYTPFGFWDLTVSEAGHLSSRGVYTSLSGVCILRTDKTEETPDWLQTNRCTATELGLTPPPPPAR